MGLLPLLPSGQQPPRLGHGGFPCVIFEKPHPYPLFQRTKLLPDSAGRYVQLRGRGLA